MRWALVTSSARQADNGLEGEAARLIGQLDLVSDFLHRQYGFRPEWRNRFADASQWRDVAAVAALIEQGVGYDESVPPQPWPELGMSGSVQAYHPDTGEGVADCTWHVGGKHTVKFSTAYAFESNTAPFPASAAEALTALLIAAAVAVEADEARISERMVQRVLRKARKGSAGRIGVLTLVSDGRGIEQWPEGVTSTAAPEGYPNGTVLSIDLERVESPNELVPVLLELDDLLRENVAAEAPTQE